MRCRRKATELGPCALTVGGNTGERSIRRVRCWPGDVQRWSVLMRTSFTSIWPMVLLAGCTCGETHSVPDASFDAPGLDVAIDAFTPPPFEPTVMWRAEDAGMCPEIMTPRFQPPAEAPIAVGQRAWGPGGRGWLSVVAPALLGDGTSIWARNLYQSTAVD